MSKMVLMAANIPSEMMTALDAFVERQESDDSKADIIRGLVANAIGFDLSAFFEEKNRARDARKAAIEVKKTFRAQTKDLTPEQMRKVLAALGK